MARIQKNMKRKIEYYFAYWCDPAVIGSTLLTAAFPIRIPIKIAISLDISTLLNTGCYYIFL
jgi:hypothetical protein